jgi:TP901 family phage tail tape measure protein
MALNQFGFGFTISAKDMASGVVANVGKSLGKLGQDAARASKAMGNGMLGGLRKADLAGGAAVEGLGFGIANAVGALRSAGPAIRAGWKNIGAYWKQGRALIGDETKGMMNDLKIAAAGGIVAAIGKKLVGFVDNLATEAMGYERNLSKVRALRGVSEKEMAAASQQILASGFNPEKASEAYKTLAERGQSAADAMTSLAPAMTFAKISGLEVADATMYVDDALDVFGLKAEEAGAVVDKTAWAMKTFGIVGTDMQAILRATAASAQLTGAGFDDVVLAGSMIAKVFPDASKAAMATNQAFMQLADKNVQKKLKGLGVDVADADGKFRPLSKTLMAVATATDKMSEQQKAATLKTIFGARAAGGMATIMGQLSDGVADSNGKLLKGAEAAAYLAQGMDSAQGSAKALEDVMTDDLLGAVDRAGIATKRWVTGWAEGASTLKRPFLEIKAMIFNNLASGLAMIPREARSVLLGIAKALGMIGMATGGVIALTMAMRAFGISFMSVLKSLAVGTLVIAPLILLLGGLSVGLYAVYRAFQKNTGGGADTWKSFTKKVSLGFRGLVELFQSGQLSKATEKELRKTGNEGVLGFVTKMGGWIENLKGFWEGLKVGFEKGVDALGPKIIALKDAFGAMFDRLFGGTSQGKEGLDAFGAAGMTAGERLAGIGGLVLDAFTALVPLIEKGAKWLMSLSAGDIAAGVQNTVTAFYTMMDVLNVIGTIFGVVWRAVTGIFNTIQMIGAFLGENLALAIDTIFIRPFKTLWEILKGIGNLISSLWSDTGFADFKANVSNIGDIWSSWWETPKFSETRQQGAEAINSFAGKNVVTGNQDQEALDQNAAAAELAGMRARSRAAAEQAQTDRIQALYSAPRNSVFAMEGAPNNAIMALAGAVDRLAKKPLTVKVDEVDKGVKAAAKNNSSRDVGENAA